MNAGKRIKHWRFTILKDGLICETVINAYSCKNAWRHIWKLAKERGFSVLGLDGKYLS